VFHSIICAIFKTGNVPDSVNKEYYPQCLKIKEKIST
jgi:hypothetical protein